MACGASAELSADRQPKQRSLKGFAPKGDSSDRTKGPANRGAFLMTCQGRAPLARLRQVVLGSQLLGPWVNPWLELAMVEKPYWGRPFGAQFPSGDGELRNIRRRPSRGKAKGPCLGKQAVLPSGPARPDPGAGPAGLRRQGVQPKTGPKAATFQASELSSSFAMAVAGERGWLESKQAASDLDQRITPSPLRQSLEMAPSQELNC